jgi:hypothetical protein
MLDVGMDAVEPEDEPELDAAREALFVLFRALLEAGYDPEDASDRLAWPAHELDVEFYWEAEGVH